MFVTVVVITIKIKRELFVLVLQSFLSLSLNWASKIEVLKHGMLLAILASISPYYIRGMCSLKCSIMKDSDCTSDLSFYSRTWKIFNAKVNICFVFFSFSVNVMCTCPLFFTFLLFRNVKFSILRFWCHWIVVIKWNKKFRHQHIGVS